MVQLRVGTPEDAGGIIDCLMATVAERVWLDRDENEVDIGNKQILQERIRRFNAEKNVYIVAVVDGQVVGFILLMRGGLKSTKHIADFGMSILPAFRDMGIGTLLVGEAIKWAKSVGVEKLYCCTFHTNQRAIKLYEKMGFVQEGTRPKQYKINGKYVDQLMFGLLL